MPIVEVDKQIDRLLGDADAYSSESEEDCEPPTPDYLFQERERIVEAFYGPDAETLDGEPALNRRIQVTKDMVALCGLSEPNRRGRRFNWNKVDDCVDDDDPVTIKIEDDSDTYVNNMKYPTDICIVCSRKITRIDSLRRHLIGQHLTLVDEDSDINCTQETCKNKTAFKDTRVFLNHTATVHKNDIKITLKHWTTTLTRGHRQQPEGQMQHHTGTQEHLQRQRVCQTLLC